MRWTTTFVVLCGATSALTGTRIRGAFALPTYAAVCLLGIAAAAADIRRKRLPFALTLPTLGIGLIGLTTQSVVEGQYSDLFRALGGGFVVAALFVALALAAPGQLGLGDVLFASGLSAPLAWLGWEQLLGGMLAAPALALLLQLILRLGRRQGRVDREFAFGPLLLLGWILGLLAVG